MNECISAMLQTRVQASRTNTCFGLLFGIKLTRINKEKHLMISWKGSSLVV